MLDISVISRSAQLTLPLLLAHDGGSILLGFLELSARHAVLGFLHRRISRRAQGNGADIGEYQDSPETGPFSGPWPDQYRVGYLES